MLRLAKQADLDILIDIIEDAKVYLKNNGVIQWHLGYPNLEVLNDDIEKEHLYIWEENDEILALAALIYGEDPTYGVIYDGQWLNSEEYATIHRTAVAPQARGKGLMSAILLELEKLVIAKGLKNIRIDTNFKNIGMQKTIEKVGYQEVGWIRLANGSQSKAYHKVLES